MQSNDSKGRPARGIRSRFAYVALAVGATAILSASAATGAAAMGSPSVGMPVAKVNSHGQKHKKHKKAKKHHKAKQAPAQPVRAVVLTPNAGDTTSSGFNLDVSLQSRNALGNALLADYTNGFLDPTGPDGNPNPAFHPGHSTLAPGLVVTLSTTPAAAGGPSTNLAGVFQINSVTQNRGLTSTWND